MAEHLDIANLAEQIRAAVPTKREYTRTGSFTAVSVLSDVTKIEAKSPASGPLFESEGIDCGGAAILFLRDSGYIETLEMYANGHHFAGAISEFKLKAWEESKQALDGTA